MQVVLMPAVVSEQNGTPVWIPKYDSEFKRQQGEHYYFSVGSKRDSMGRRLFNRGVVEVTVTDEEAEKLLHYIDVRKGGSVA